MMHSNRYIPLVVLFLIFFFAALSADANEAKRQVFKTVSDSHPQTSWDTESIVSADINCDSIDDYAIIGIENNIVRLTVIIVLPENLSKMETLVFGLGDSLSQISLCGDKPKLMLESLQYDISTGTGEKTTGLNKTLKCNGLRLYDEVCDSFHIFWNHETNTLDYFRL